ncbi:MAG: hypothetical protein KBA60_04650 [Flavobacteriales bacterium]|nr:hypothetical protein [Flavobacteriales bacterium]MBP6641659.1 hypothetical protein [Flavobacteriales bacterium]MBP7155274.1 hypothetical protein [Flavobacteriales bacterium]HQV74786.1 hypothetical protein [Flavobacteriales bacterium]HQW40157.1 hypothetical protein [Flavobacteriales bacterium]
MSENPFKIIRSTDLPPEHLKQDVVSSVKRIMLLMRFMQLFMSDYSMAVFEKFRLVGSGNGTSANRPDTDLKPDP